MAKKASKRGGARAGAGRPSKYNGDSQVVSVKMPKKLAAAIDRHAKSVKQSRNEVIVTTLQNAFA